MGKKQEIKDAQAFLNAYEVIGELLASLVEIRQLITPNGEYAITRRDGKLMGMGESVSIGFVFERVDAAIAKTEGGQ